MDRVVPIAQRLAGPSNYGLAYPALLAPPNAPHETLDITRNVNITLCRSQCAGLSPSTI
jgi:hypothetical protein